MSGLPIMAWLRKRCGVFTSEERIVNKDKKEKTLKKWREEVTNKRLKIRDSKVNESPYTTYFFRYCLYCDNFRPNCCFIGTGNLFWKDVDSCSKLRLNNELLEQFKLSE